MRNTLAIRTVTVVAASSADTRSSCGLLVPFNPRQHAAARSTARVSGTWYSPLGALSSPGRSCGSIRWWHGRRSARWRKPWYQLTASMVRIYSLDWQLHAIHHSGITLTSHTPLVNHLDCHSQNYFKPWMIVSSTGNHHFRRKDTHYPPPLQHCIMATRRYSATALTR